MNLSVILLCSLASVSTFAADIDCSEVYGGIASKCAVISCPSRYLEFIGRWEGEFQSFDRALNDFRPYHNAVSYRSEDCLKNIENGDTFIIGRKSDMYPAYHDLAAKTEMGLLITGRTRDDKRFLRTIDKENGIVNYDLAFSDSAADLSVWKFILPASNTSPEMTFTTIDGRDWTQPKANTRFVTVSLKIASPTSIDWEGIVVKGSHTKK